MDGSDTDSLGAEWDFHNGLKCNFKDINASLQTILAVTNDEQVEFTYLSVDRERQQLIHNTGAPSLVLTLLKQGSSMLVNRQNADCEISEFVSELFHIFAHCYRFMRTYTFNNQEYVGGCCVHAHELCVRAVARVDHWPTRGVCGSCCQVPGGAQRSRGLPDAPDWPASVRRAAAGRCPRCQPKPAQAYHGDVHEATSGSHQPAGQGRGTVAAPAVLGLGWAGPPRCPRRHAARLAHRAPRHGDGAIL